MYVYTKQKKEIMQAADTKQWMQCFLLYLFSPLNIHELSGHVWLHTLEVSVTHLLHTLEVSVTHLGMHAYICMVYMKKLVQAAGIKQCYNNMF